MPKVLLIEDDDILSLTIQRWLKTLGHSIDAVKDGESGLHWLRDCTYDLCILDWGLPTISGLTVCQQYRGTGGQTPILMLTARSTLKEKTTGLDSGADDYLTKPFEKEEFISRVKALLRRPLSYTASVLHVGAIELDTNTKIVTCAQQQVELIPREFAILEFLLKHPGQVFSADVLVDRVWPSDLSISTQTVRSHIARLREKLGPVAGKQLQTVHGFGYALGHQAPASADC